MVVTKCPKCRRQVSSKPLNKWRFRNDDVARFGCPGRKTKFNFYSSPKGTFTIPKSAG